MTWSEPHPGLGSIPSEPRLSTSIVIDLDHDDGIFETPCEPSGIGSTLIAINLDDDDGADETLSESPGLGSIPSEHRLSTSTVIDLDDDNGADESSSEPTGLGLMPFASPMASLEQHESTIS